MEVNWLYLMVGILQAVVTGIAVGIPAFLVLRIHQRHEDVRMHKIGKLSENQKEILKPRPGNCWKEEGGYYRRFQDNARMGTSGSSYAKLAVRDYVDDMNKLLLYGLVVEEVVGVNKESIIRSTAFGQFEYARQEM